MRRPLSTMLTYSDALKYLDSFVNYERIGLELSKGEFDLDKLRKVLRKIGDPHRSYRSIHIAGTKGKGSVSVFTSSILKEAGYRVGLFTSPHLISIRERICVNNKIITEAGLIQAVKQLRGIIDPCLSPKRFSFFEIYTLLAMLYFKMKKVDIAVFECGLGGRLDATNVIDAEVCGFSPVSYDHVQVLGRRIDEIAGEKAGIVKKGARCVSSPQRPAVLRIIKTKCREKGASLSVVGENITFKLKEFSGDGSCFDILGEKNHYEGCHAGMLGDFQAENCATAVGICEPFFKGVPSVGAVKEGISSAFLPGRMEIICRKPFLIIDGAQNPESAARLKYSIEQIFKYGKLILLLGLSRDKDIRGVLKELSPLVDEFIVTRASVERAADPYIIKGYIKDKKVNIAEDVKEALSIAFGRAGREDLILATGSFFLIGEIRRLLVGDNV